MFARHASGNAGAELKATELTACRLLPESPHELVVCELDEGVVLFWSREDGDTQLLVAVQSSQYFNSLIPKCRSPPSRLSNASILLINYSFD